VPQKGSKTVDLSDQSTYLKVLIAGVSFYDLTYAAIYRQRFRTGHDGNQLPYYINQNSAQTDLKTRHSYRQLPNFAPRNTESICKDCNLLSYFEPNRNASISARAPLTCGVSKVFSRLHKTSQMPRNVSLPSSDDLTVHNKFLGRQKQTKRCRPSQRLTVMSHIATCFGSHEPSLGTSLYNNLKKHTFEWTPYFGLFMIPMQILTTPACWCPADTSWHCFCFQDPNSYPTRRYFALQVDSFHEVF